MCILSLFAMPFPLAVWFVPNEPRGTFVRGVSSNLLSVVRFFGDWSLRLPLPSISSSARRPLVTLCLRRRRYRWLLPSTKNCGAASVQPVRVLGLFPVGGPVDGVGHISHCVCCVGCCPGDRLFTYSPPRRLVTGSSFRNLCRLCHLPVSCHSFPSPARPPASCVSLPFPVRDSVSSCALVCLFRCLSRTPPGLCCVVIAPPVADASVSPLPYACVAHLLSPFSSPLSWSQASCCVEVCAIYVA